MVVLTIDAVSLGGYMIVKKEIELAGRPLSIEVGRIASQADGSAWVRYGDNITIATVVSSKDLSENQDFFPLSVDYREKMYAAGKIPGAQHPCRKNQR